MLPGTIVADFISCDGNQFACPHLLRNHILEIRILQVMWFCFRFNAHREAFAEKMGHASSVEGINYSNKIHIFEKSCSDNKPQIYFKIEFDSQTKNMEFP